MQRLLAGIVAVAMLLTSGSAVPRHVHASAGHDHEEHQHGVADHLHVAAGHAPHAEANADHGPEIEGCDPGTHAVSVTFVCASPESAPSLVAVAFDAGGRRLGEARQQVNRATSDAEAGFALERDGTGRVYSDDGRLV